MKKQTVYLFAAYSIPNIVSIIVLNKAFEEATNAWMNAWIHSQQ